MASPATYTQRARDGGSWWVAVPVASSPFSRQMTAHQMQPPGGEAGDAAVMIPSWEGGADAFVVLYSSIKSVFDSFFDR